MESASHGPQPISSTSTAPSYSVVFDERERFAEWARERINTPSWGDWYESIGLLEDGEPIAAVVYTHYTGTDISMHVAATPGTRWATKKFLGVVFGYPFNQLKVRRVSGYVPAKNKAAFKFDLALGFKREGVKREALEDDDLIVLGMTKRECKWV